MRTDFDPREESGFTLIEVLVGLAVLGLVGSLLTGVLSLAAGQHRRAAETQRAGEASLGASRLLHNLTEGAVSVHDGPAGWYSVRGDSGEFVLMSMGPPVLALGAPVRFSLKREESRRGYDLLMTWEDPVSRQERSEIVLADAAELSFSYFTPSDGGWTSVLRPQSGRVGAIRLAVRFGRNDPTFDLIAPLPAKLPAPCAANPVGPNCKDWLP